MLFTSDAITKRVKQQPFVPLRIITSSGDRYEIYHPDLIMVGRRDITVGTASKKNPAHYEEQSRIALLHVASIEDMPVGATPSTESNGAS